MKHSDQFVNKTFITAMAMKIDRRYVSRLNPPV